MRSPTASGPSDRLVARLVGIPLYAKWQGYSGHMDILKDKNGKIVDVEGSPGLLDQAQNAPESVS